VANFVTKPVDPKLGGIVADRVENGAAARLSGRLLAILSGQKRSTGVSALSGTLAIFLRDEPHRKDIVATIVPQIERIWIEMD
jgi:hypothetical protein